MSDEIRTPKGRIVPRVERYEDGSGRYEIEAFGCAITTGHTPGNHGFFWPDTGTRYGSLDDCLRWLDARADETVAALLPPGAIVVSEERVRELARVLVTRIATDIPQGVVMPNERIEALIADLRAEGQS